MVATWTLSRRWSAIRLTLAGAGLACSLACDDAPSSPAIETPDAAVCERGTEACSCVSGGGCRDGLLCIAGRCLTSQADDVADEPPLTRPRPRPPLPGPGVIEDAGSGPVGDAGASVGAEAGAVEDGGAPAPAADASL